MTSAYPDIEGQLYTTGAPDSTYTEAEARQRAASRREDAATASAAGASALADAKAYTDARAGEVSRKAAAYTDHRVSAVDVRIRAVETMAGLAPGEVTDAQTANLITQEGTLTRAAVDAVAVQVVQPLVVDALASDSTVADAAAAAVRDVGVVTWTPGKNLYNPALDTVDHMINVANGNLTAIAGYRASGFIPVKGGQAYTINWVRNYAFYDGGKAFLTGASLTQGQHTVTPTSDGFLRFAYAVSTLSSPTTVQVEAGTTATSYEPYGRGTLDLSAFEVTGLDVPVPTAGPLSATRTATSLTVETPLGTKPLLLQFDLASRENRVLNIRDTKLAGATVHAMNDEPAPLRTQHGTIGANHGFAQLYVWPATAHDKTTADLGSVWSDGSREYVLLGIDPSGRAFFGGDYTRHSSGMSMMAIDDPAGPLTHVSGATSTTSLDPTKKLARGAAQLWPAVQRVRTAVFVDGKPLTSGTAAGQQVEVRESYEVLEYSSVYETAKAHPGTSYADHRVDGCVRVESVYRIGSGGVASVDVSLTEITPTQLYATGLVQAVALSGSPTRYLPGVKAKGGYDWSAGVDLSTYSVTQLITTADLHSPTAPPVMSVDVRPDIAFVLGIHPWKPGPSHARDRLTEAPTNLWDLRSTKKSYPSVIVSEAPGWGRYEGHAVRAYLTPEQAAQVVSAGPDALGAWAALETVAQLP